MEIRSFLEEMEKRGDGNLLFEEGKEGTKVDKVFLDELKEKKIGYTWIYQPEGYDLVVMEHDKDGEKPNSWSMAFFTEAEKVKPGEEEEEIFGEARIDEQGQVGMKMLNQTKGNFLDIVQLAIEVASNKAYKQGFTAAKIKQVMSKAKAKK